jgi:hypothetical protein
LIAGEGSRARVLSITTVSKMAMSTGVFDGFSGDEARDRK